MDVGIRPQLTLAVLVTLSPIEIIDLFNHITVIMLISKYHLAYHSFENIVIIRPAVGSHYLMS